MKLKDKVAIITVITGGACKRVRCSRLQYPESFGLLRGVVESDEGSKPKLVLQTLEL